MNYSLTIASAFCGLTAAWAQPANYVQVSPRDPRYLELSDGKPYIPVGLNMISPPGTRNGEEAALRGLECDLNHNFAVWQGYVYLAFNCSLNARRGRPRRSQWDQTASAQ